MLYIIAAIINDKLNRKGWIKVLFIHTFMYSSYEMLCATYIWAEYFGDLIELFVISVYCQVNLEHFMLCIYYVVLNATLDSMGTEKSPQMGN